MTTTSQPRIDVRPQQSYMGIRVQTPMSGMSKTVGKIFKEINRWAKLHDVHPAGPPFLRYHVINMAGEMDIEVGIPVETTLAGDARVTVGELPAGRYASLIYTGSGYSGNKTLIDWVRANHYDFDRWDDPKGDAFRGRYETYLTDPAVEPRKTKWQIEVAIKLAD